MASSIYIFLWGRSSLHLFLGARCPNQWWWAYLGQGRWTQFQSWWMDYSCHCKLIQVIAPVTSLFVNYFRMLLAQGQKCSLPSQCTGPGSQSWLWATGLVYFDISWPCTSWSWMLYPCYHQLVSSINYPQWLGWFWFDHSPIFPWSFLFWFWIHFLFLPSFIQAYKYVNLY